jgi:hypothetical protein
MTIFDCRFLIWKRGEIPESRAKRRSLRREKGKCGGHRRAATGRDGEFSDGQRQFADTEDLAGEQWLEVRGANGSHGNRFAQGVEDLDGVCSLAIGGGMEINDLHDVPGAKTMLGNVTSQDGIGIEFKFHERLAGIKVMNLVCPDKSSFIQTVRTSNVRPFGPVSGQEISKYCP